MNIDELKINLKINQNVVMTKRKKKQKIGKIKIDELINFLSVKILNRQ